MNPRRVTHGHGHADHGYQTTDSQHEYRIQYGIAPSGNTAPIASTARFHSPQVEAEALGRARRILDKDIKKGLANPFDANGELNRVTVTVTTQNPDGFGSSRFYDANTRKGRQIDPPGARTIIEERLVLSRARVVFEYVPSANTWQPVTYYPTR